MESDRLAEYLAKRIEKTASCWLWKGKRRSDGYGTVSALAHRLVYELLKGEIGEGLALDHLCRNHGCVNPAHLDPVVNAVNVLRGEAPTAIHARKTHCVNGHPFDEDNTYVYRNTNGRMARACRTCRNNTKRGFYHANKPPLKPKKQRTHCKRGHFLDEANTYTWTGKNGTQKYCLKCRTEYRAKGHSGLRRAEQRVENAERMKSNEARREEGFRAAEKPPEGSS